MPSLPQIRWIGAGFDVQWISCDTGALSEQLVQINQVYQYTYAQVNNNVSVVAGEIQVATGASAQSIIVLETFLTNWVNLVTRAPALICFIDESTPLINN